MDFPANNKSLHEKFLPIGLRMIAGASLACERRRISGGRFSPEIRLRSQASASRILFKNLFKSSLV